MKIHNVVQGSQEWHALRSEFFTASEAPAMMGASKYQTRDQLLAQKASGLAPEVDEHTQRRFDRGHATEAAARLIVEKMIGEALFPIVASIEIGGLLLLASVDGSTMTGEILYEHKLLNQELIQQVAAKALDPHYYWQLEQQLLVTGAERVVFATSDGTFENLHWMEYRAVPGRREKLIAGWRQFAEDLASYEYRPEPIVLAPAPVTALPAISYRLNGLALTSNVEEYREAAARLVEESRKELQTDQDFADAEARIKSFKEAEDKIGLVKTQVIGELRDIDQFTRSLSEIGELIRQARLNSERQVKSRKETIRQDIARDGAALLVEHIAKINTGLKDHGVSLGSIPADFAGVIKGKRTVASLRDAVNTELARAKIAANERADQIRTNLATIDKFGGKHMHLFADKQQLVMREPADLEDLVKARVIGFEADEARKRQAQPEPEPEAVSAPEPQAVLSHPGQAARPAPAPASAAPAARTVIPVRPTIATPRPVQQHAPERPSDEAILQALADHFAVDDSTALMWLRQFDFAGASQRLAS